MKLKIKAGLYVVVFILWLFVREWPFGDMLQTATDVALIFAGLLGCFNYMKKKYNERPRT